MRNALLLVGIWVGIIFFAYSVVYLPGDRAPLVTLAGDSAVVDEAHGVALSLPTGWGLRSTADAMILIAPIAGVEGWAMTLPAATVDDALAAAWELIEPCAPCQRSAILDSAAPSAGRDGAILDLGADGEGRTGRAAVLLESDGARILLLRLAEGLEVPARVEGDIARILAGFQALPRPAAPDDAEPAAP